MVENAQEVVHLALSNIIATTWPWVWDVFIPAPQAVVLDAAVKVFVFSAYVVYPYIGPYSSSLGT